MTTLTDADIPGRSDGLAPLSTTVTGNVATPEVTVACSATWVTLPATALLEPAATTSAVCPIAISLLLWLYSFYLIYGVFDPEAPYGGYTRLYVLNANIPRGLLGLLFALVLGRTYFSLGVTRNTPPSLESSSIQSAPSGATSTSRIRWPTSQRSAGLAPPLSQSS